MLVTQKMTLEQLVDYMWENGEYTSVQYEDDTYENILEDGGLMFSNDDFGVFVGFNRTKDGFIRIGFVEIEAYLNKKYIKE